MAPNRLTLAVTWLTLMPSFCWAQQESACFSSSSIIGAVLGTFFSTLAAVAVVFLIWWICCRRRSTGKSPKAATIENGAGFDNPCFEEHPETDGSDGRKAPHDGLKDSKSSSWTPLRFFGTSRNEKKHSLDDSFVTEPERVSVQLRGHDFTGLGFNVTGNMRDGIFVKDILNRGPAFESGRINQGDKILSATISFQHMVYEDALTILSYASPYDVTLVLEKSNQCGTLKVGAQRRAASSVSLAASAQPIVLVSGLNAQDATNNERLIHPLYRSQSIDDLSKVGKLDAALKTDVKLPSGSAQLTAAKICKSKPLGKASIEVDLPEYVDDNKPNMKDLSIDIPDVKLSLSDGAKKEKSSKFPKFGIKVLPDVKLKGDMQADVTKLPKLAVDLESSLHKSEINMPKIEVHVQKPSHIAVSLDPPGGPLIQLPEVAINAPSITDLQVSAEAPPLLIDNAEPFKPKGDIAIDIHAPEIELANPEAKTISLDIESALLEHDIIAPKMILPDINIKGPSVDISPSMAVNVEGGIPAVSYDTTDSKLTLKARALQSTQPAKDESTGFHIKLPKFGGKSPKISVDADLALEPNVVPPQAEFNIQNVDPDLDGNTKDDLPSDSSQKSDLVAKLELPSVNIHTSSMAELPDGKLPLLEIDPNYGRLESSTTLTLPSFEYDIHPPPITVEDSNNKKETKKSKLSLGFSLPKFSVGKTETEVEDVHSSEESDVNINLPKISASVQLPQNTVELPQLKVESKVDGDEHDEDLTIKKKKFGIKMPKLPKGKLHGEIDVSPPKVDVDTSDNDDEKEGEKKKSKFSLKMPKWNVNKSVEQEIHGPELKLKHEIPDVELRIPVSVEVSPTVDIHQEEREGQKLNVNLPEIMGDSKQEDTESDGEEEMAKKKGKFSIKIPKFNLSKPQLEIGHGIAVEVSSERPVEANLKSVEVDEKTDKKKGKLGLKKFDPNFSEPELQTEPGDSKDIILDLPSVEVEVDRTKEENYNGDKKKKFSLKMPKFGLGKPHVETEVEGIKDIAAEISSSEIPKLTKDIKQEVNVEIPIPEFPKPQVELQIPTAVMNVVPSKGSTENEDSDDEKGEKKRKFSLKMPKFGISKPQLDINAGVSVGLPKVTPAESQQLKTNVELNVPVLVGGDLEAKPSTDITDVSLQASLPKAAVELKQDDQSDTEGAENTKKKFGFKMPRFGLSKPQLDIDIGSDVNTGVSLKTASSEVKREDEDGDGKGKSKFSIKMPKLHIGKVHGDFDVPGSKEVKLEVSPHPAVDIEGDVNDEAGKKKHKFRIKMPKFHAGALAASENSEDKKVVVIPSVEVARIEMMTGHADVHSGEQIELEKRQKAKKIGVKLPKIEAGASLSNADLTEAKTISITTNVPKLELKMEHDNELKIKGNVSDASKNEVNIGVQLPKSNMDIDFPDTLHGKEVSIDAVGAAVLRIDGNGTERKDDNNDEENASEKKKKAMKFGIKLPKFHGVTNPSIEVGEEKKIALDANVNVPTVEIDMERSGDHSDEESTSDKKKKSSKFGIKMPKFHGASHPSVEVGEGKNITIDANVEVPTVNVDIERPDDHSDEESAPDKKKKSSKFGIKMPKFHGISHPNVEVGEEKDIAIDVNVEVPTVNVDIELPDDDSDEESTPDKKKKAMKFGIKLPKFHGVDNPNMKVGEEKIALDASVNVPTVDIGVERTDDYSDEESTSEKKKKAMKFGIKLPKFHGVGHSNIEVDEDKIALDTGVDVPAMNIGAERTGDHSDEESTPDKKKKAMKFGIKLPKFHGVGNSNIEVGEEKIGIDANVNVPTVDIDVEHTDGHSDEESTPEKKKKSTKFGIKMPKLHGVSHPNIEVGEEKNITIDAHVTAPTVDTDMGPSDDHSDEETTPVKKKKSTKFGIKMPKFHRISHPNIEADEKKITVDANVNVSAVDVNIERADDHSDEENVSEKKKKSTKFGIMLPKFHGTISHSDVEPNEGKISEVKTNVELPHMELKRKDSDDENGEKSAPKNANKGQKFGIQLPGFHIGKPHIESEITAGENISLKPIEHDVGIEVTSVKRTDLIGSRSVTVRNTEQMAANDFEIPDMGIADYPQTMGIETEIGQPELDITVNLADSESIDEKKRGIFNVKMPKFHMKKPDIDIQAEKVFGGTANIDSQQVSVDVKTDLTGEDSGENKLYLGLNPPKLQMKKYSPELDAELSADIDIKDSDSESQSSDSDDERDEKRKMKFGVKLPKFHIKKPNVEMEASVQGDANMPKLGISSDSSSNEENEKNVQSAIQIGLTKPSVDSNVTLSKDADLKVGFKVPNVNLTVPRGEIPMVKALESSVQVDVGVSEIEGIKSQLIPGNDTSASVTMDSHISILGLPHYEANIKIPQGSIASDSTEISIPSSGKFPSLHGSSSRETVSIPSVEVGYSEPNVGIDVGGNPIFNTTINVPDIGFQFGIGGHEEIEANISKVTQNPNANVAVETGEISVKTDFPKSSFDVDNEDSEKKKSKFGFKMPKIHLGKHHGELKFESAKESKTEAVVNVGLQEPDDVKVTTNMPGSAELSLGVDIDMPVLEGDFPKAYHPRDGESDEEKKDSNKKKSIFGIKMPKFHMNKPQAEVDAHLSKEIVVDIKAPKIDMDIKTEDDNEPDEADKRKGKFVLKMPKFHMNKPDLELHKEVEIKDEGLKLKINVDEDSDSKTATVDTNKLVDERELSAESDISKDIEAKIVLPKVDVEIRENEKEGSKKKGKFSFKIPKLHMGGKSQSEVDVTKPNTSDGLVVLSKAELDIHHKEDSDDDGDSGEKKKNRFGIKMPKLRKPQVDVELPRGVTLEVTSLTVETSDSLSDKGKHSEDLESHDKMKTSRTMGLPEIQSAVPSFEENMFPEADVEVKISGTDNLLVVQEGKLEIELNNPVTVISDRPLQPSEILIVKSQIPFPGGYFDDTMDKQEDNNEKTKSQSSVSFNMGKSGFKLNPEVNIPSSDFHTNFEHYTTPTDTKQSITIPEYQEVSNINFDVPPADGTIKGLEISPFIRTSEDLTKGTLKFNTSLQGPRLSTEGNSDTTISYALSVENDLPKGEIEVNSKGENGNMDIEKLNIEFGILATASPYSKVNIDIPSSDGSDFRLSAIRSTESKLNPELPAAAHYVGHELDSGFGKTIDSSALAGLEGRSQSMLFPVRDVSITKPPKNAGDFNMDVCDANASISFPSITRVDIQADSSKVKYSETSLQIKGIPALDVGVDSSSLDFHQVLGKTSHGSESENRWQRDNDSDHNDDQLSSKRLGLEIGIPSLRLGEENVETRGTSSIDSAIDLPTQGLLETKLKAEGPKSPLNAEANTVSSVGEKEKKKFNLGLKMPKLNLSKHHLESDNSARDADLNLETKPLKVKMSKAKTKKRKDDDSRESDASDEDKKESESKLPARFIDVDVKLPRVPVARNVDHSVDSGKTHESSSSEEEDESRDIKKNIGARFGVKLKKPRIFVAKQDTAKPDVASSLQPEWKLPRVDLRRTVKPDQELSVNIDLDGDQKLEQLSPSERAEAIRRDAKISTGIRMHSSGINLASPRSKKSSLPKLEVESSPKLLSVTRLDPTPPTEVIDVTPSFEVVSGAKQVSVSDVPQTLIMASEAVKLKRGPPTPAKRNIFDITAGHHVIIAATTESAEPTSLKQSENLSLIQGVDNNPSFGNIQVPRNQVSDTDISIIGTDTLIITTTGDTPTNRKAASLGDLTRIPPSIAEDGTLERTVSLDLKPIVSAGEATNTRAIHNLAIHDLSRVGEDSDEDFSLNRKRIMIDSIHINTGEQLIHGVSVSPKRGSNRTLLAVDTDGTDVSIRPLPSENAEELWFGHGSIQPFSVSLVTESSPIPSLNTEITLATSLGSSPSETSSSDHCSTSPASLEPVEDSPSLLSPRLQVKNGNSQQNRTEVIELTREELDAVNFAPILSTTIRGPSFEVDTPDECQPQPLSDLNPSAGNFAAVRNRFEQLSNRNETNGTETATSRTSGRVNQSGIVKRLSGSFEDGTTVTFVQKPVMHIAPELSEGALSRTVIISSLQLERSETSASGVGPESPVPNLEPPC